MMSRFVEQLFYNDWLAYSLFEEWAVARIKIDPGSAMYVEEWMTLKDDGCLVALTAEHQAKEQEAQVDKGSIIQSSKHSTHCAHTGLGEQTLSARAAQDISCIPEYLPRKLTDKELEDRKAMEDTIALQAQEEKACVARVGALCAKFAKAAQEKALGASLFSEPNKKIMWAVDEVMGNAHVSSSPSTTCRGTEFVHTKKISKLSKQLANAEKVAATAISLAVDLQNPVDEAERSPVLARPAQATMEVPPGTSGMSTSARGMMDLQEGSALPTQPFSDFATLHQDRQDRAAPCSQLSLPTDVTPSFSTADSLSAILSTSNQGGHHVRLLALNASTYSFPHGSLPANKNTKGGDDKDMFSMVQITTPGAAGHFWFLLAGFEFIEGADSRTTMLAGMSALVKIFSGIITDFQVFPINPESTLPVLTSNWPKEDFP